MIEDFRYKLNEKIDQNVKNKNSGMETSLSDPIQVNESFEDSPASNKVSEAHLNYASLG